MLRVKRFQTSHNCSNISPKCSAFSLFSTTTLIATKANFSKFYFSSSKQPPKPLPQNKNPPSIQTKPTPINNAADKNGKKIRSKSTNAEAMDELAEDDDDYMDDDEYEMDEEDGFTEDDMYQNFNTGRIKEVVDTRPDIDPEKIKKKRIKNFGTSIVNYKIPSHQVQLISAEGKGMGVVSKVSAIKQAEEQDMDLLQVSAKGPNGVPICKIVDFHKYMYQQAKKAAASSQKTVEAKNKEIRFKSQIQERDLAMKTAQMLRFFQDNCVVKVTLMMTLPQTRTPLFVKLFFEEIYQRTARYANPATNTVPLGNKISLTFQPLSKDKQLQLEQKLKAKGAQLPPWNLTVTISEEQQQTLAFHQNRQKEDRSRLEAMHQKQLSQYSKASPSSASSSSSTASAPKSLWELMKTLNPGKQYSLKDKIKQRKGGMKEIEKPADPDRNDPEDPSGASSGDSTPTTLR